MLIEELKLIWLDDILWYFVLVGFLLYYLLMWIFFGVLVCICDEVFGNFYLIEKVDG